MVNFSQGGGGVEFFLPVDNFKGKAVVAFYYLTENKRYLLAKHLTIWFDLPHQLWLIIELTNLPLLFAFKSSSSPSKTSCKKMQANWKNATGHLDSVCFFVIILEIEKNNEIYKGKLEGRILKRQPFDHVEITGGAVPLPPQRRSKVTSARVTKLIEICKMVRQWFFKTAALLRFWYPPPTFFVRQLKR